MIDAELKALVEKKGLAAVLCQLGTLLGREIEEIEELEDPRDARTVASLEGVKDKIFAAAERYLEVIEGPATAA